MLLLFILLQMVAFLTLCSEFCFTKGSIGVGGNWRRHGKAIEHFNSIAELRAAAVKMKVLNKAYVDCMHPAGSLLCGQVD